MIYEEINAWANSLLEGKWWPWEKEDILSFVPEVAEISSEDFDAIIDRMEEITDEWEFQVKEEFYDLWGADEDNDIVTLKQIREFADTNNWDKPIEELLSQVKMVEV